MAEPNSGIAVPGESQGSDAAPAIEEAIKTKARELGWKPKTEWDKDPADWVSAKEFVGRQSLFDKIKSVKDDNYHLRRENAEMRRDLSTIKDYVQKMSKVEYDRALADLRAQKAKAVEAADTHTVAQIDTQIDTLKEAQASIKAEPQVQAATTPPPEFFEWKSKNPWYDTDSELQDFANEQGQAILARNKNLSPAEVLKRVEDRVKRMYPEKFGKSTPKAPAVEAGGGSAPTPKTSGKLRISDLSDMERKAMDAFVKRGVLTEAQYLEQLSKNR